jgi:hypothetical protein
LKKDLKKRIEREGGSASYLKYGEIFGLSDSLLGSLFDCVLSTLDRLILA